MMGACRSTLLLLVSCCSMLFLSPAAAWACSAALPSAEGMVEGADVIVRAKALRYVRPAEAKAYRRVTPAGVELEFRVAEVLTGEGVPSALTVRGHLVEADDFNDRPVPYDFVRPGGRGGMCSAYEYKKGAEYLLFLKKKKGGGLTPYWYALAPVNEQLRSADDPWLAWVKGRLTHGGASGRQDAGLRPAAKKLGEYSDACRQRQQGVLKEFAAELARVPEAQGYVIVYGGRRSPSMEAAREHGDRMQRHLIELGVDPVRIRTVDGGFREEFTWEAWVVPKGATPPTPTPSIGRGEVELSPGGGAAPCPSPGRASE